MAETPFRSLAPADKRDALVVAANRSERRAYLLEKDIWVVETLKVLVQTAFGRHLTFKGGTSLAKVWRAIRRFSEDIDITYDIRAFAPDLVGGAGDEALPPTRSQEQRWTKAIRHQLAAWVREQALPTVEAGLARDGFAARVRAEGERLYVGYEPSFDDYGFVRPEVLVDFGARSTGEPRETRPIKCDAAAFLPDLSFPEACPTVMLAERTFWEKATSMHVFCLRQRGRGDRLSRHWHDVVRLDDAGIVNKALADDALARAVARHKAMFFREKDATDGWVDYEAAVSGKLQLVPAGSALDALADDYAGMLANGLLLADGEPFEVLIERCADIETRANRPRAGGGSAG